MKLKTDPEFKSLIPPLSDGLAYTGYAAQNGISWFIRLFPHVEPGYYFIEVASLPSGIADYSKSALKSDYLYMFAAQAGAPCTGYEWESFSKSASIKNPFAPTEKNKSPISQAVYFIQARHLGLIKIGIAAFVEERLRTLQTGSPDELVLLATESGGCEREQFLHGMFRSSRSHGEWFRPSEELISYIEGL